MKKAGLYIVLLLFPLFATGQKKFSSFEFKGYLSNMQSAMFEDFGKDWIIDGLFHNRLNFYWHGGEQLNASIQFRNRMMYGETLKLIPGYIDNIAKNDGLFDLSYNLISGESYVLNSTIDRIWFQYSTQGFSATVGRQRINWGQTLVWNVNDVFNTYSYFDFDYEERPGADALRLQFYPDYTSTIETAVKIDSAHRVTVAAMYRFNVFSYDIQLLAGLLSEEDYLGGIGWSGNIGGAGFRGEATYFHPKENFSDTSGMFMGSVGLDYTFPNTLMLQGEYLYSSNPYLSTYGFLDYYSGPLTVKQLAFTLVVDVVPTPTSRFADLILPGATRFECFGQPGLWNTHVTMSNMVIKPLWESRDELEVILDLACRLGMGKDFWDGDYKAMLNDYLSPVGVTLEQLKENSLKGINLPRSPLMDSRERYEMIFKHMPNGKIQLYNKVFQDHGFSPLPSYKGEFDDKVMNEQEREGYPLLFTDEHSDYISHHSFMRDIPWLREIKKHPIVKIHPLSAQQFGIKDGDWVIIKSPHGQMKAVAFLFRGIRPDTIMAQHGWWQGCNSLQLAESSPFENGINPNNLYDWKRKDTITGDTTKDTFVRIMRGSPPDTITQIEEVN